MTWKQYSGTAVVIVNNYCVLLPNDDAYTFYIDNPEWQSLVKLMRQWYQASYIKQDAVTNTDYTAEERPAGYSWSKRR